MVIAVQTHPGSGARGTSERQASDQNLALVATLDRDDVSPPLDHLVGFLQGASIAPEDRARLIKASIKEIEQIVHEEWGKKP